MAVVYRTAMPGRRPTAFTATLPSRAEGVWVALRRLTLQGRDFEPGQEVPELFHANETALRGLWSMGSVEFRRYRGAAGEARDVVRLTQEIAHLEERRDELMTEIMQLEQRREELQPVRELLEALP